MDEIGKIRRVLFGNVLARGVSAASFAGLRLSAQASWIPRSVKRTLAELVYQSEEAKRSRLTGIGQALYALGGENSVPVHLHRQEYEGIPYNMWEELSLMGEKKTDLTVFFPSITLVIVSGMSF